jgi:hypothetical protein
VAKPIKTEVWITGRKKGLEEEVKNDNIATHYILDQLKEPENAKRI